MFAGVGVLLFLGAACPGSADREAVLKHAWDKLAFEYLRKAGGSCRGCTKMREELIGDFQEVNLTDIRIEMAKQYILSKLGLTAPPNLPKRQGSLPNLITEGSVFRKNIGKGTKKSQRVSVESVVNFATDVSCSVDNTGLNLKIKFELNEKIRGRLLSAFFWLYSPWMKKNNGLLSSKPCGAPGQSKTKPTSIQPSTTNYKDGWIEKNVTWIIQDQEDCYNFKVAWSGENLTSVNCSLYQETTKRPFITAEIISEKEEDVFRPKRNVNCAEGITDCCREKLYLSFAQIGWGDWIIQPKGYDAYYCKGTCASAASIALSATPYHSVIKKLYLSNSGAAHITPCCTPTKLSPVQLIYLIGNGTVVEQIIQDLTVESCGCM